jgi:hypothetical protein
VVADVVEDVERLLPALSSSVGVASAVLGISQPDKGAALREAVTDLRE